MKWCPRCEQVKEDGDFYRLSNGTLKSFCKTCNNKYWKNVPRTTRAERKRRKESK